MKRFCTTFVILITLNYWQPMQANGAPGPKIEGPWVWAIVSTGTTGGEVAATSGVDFLSVASRGSVTEETIATNGAMAGDVIGNQVWTPGKIASTGGNNITDMLNTIGLGGNRDNYVAYGCIVLHTPREQNTVMYAGSDDAVKVWLNGELVHDNPVDRPASDYQESFPVTLKQGENILLIAVYEAGGIWSGFFGFENNTAYTFDTRYASYFPVPKIEGPWVWTIASTGAIGGAAAASTGIDYLSLTSGGSVTERKIATNGAMAGDVAGNQVWTSGKIASTERNNITNMLNAIGLGGDKENHVAYGCISLYTSRRLNTTMYVEANDVAKIWLNGESVHHKPVDRAASDYQESFPVTLKQGENILLVAVYQSRNDWTGFFGLENNTAYSLDPKQVGDFPGPKIEGPWVWTIASTGTIGGAAAASTGIDYLSLTSGGSVTERKIATNGAMAGDVIGDQVWISGKIASTGRDNITDMLNTIGLGGDKNDHVAYGCISVYTSQKQNTTMYVGSDDAVKVWLNGELIHYNPVDRAASDYQESFPVTLKQGKNILLVAIYERTIHWSGFFGFTGNAEYSLSPVPIMEVEAVEPEPPLSDSQSTSSTPSVEEDEVTEPPKLYGDLNTDGVVDIQDLVLVVSNFGKTGQNSADVNGDGIVNISDLVLVAGALGESAAAPSLRPDSLEMFTAAEVRAWLSQAYQVNNINVNYQRGMLVLAELLVALTPKETILLPNYPNPFNPETWIPYNLEKSSDVKITIYDAKGTLVYTLDLGHQSVGFYTSRSRAAYWDGRNTLGERVASGIYFYQLQVDNASFLRKMIILK